VELGLTACGVGILRRHVPLITPAMLFASSYLFAGAIESLLPCNNYPCYLSIVQGKVKAFQGGLEIMFL
jgi:hypothetical protein